MKKHKTIKIAELGCLAALVSIAMLSGCGKKAEETGSGDERVVSEEAEAASREETEAPSGSEADGAAEKSGEASAEGDSSPQSAGTGQEGSDLPDPVHTDETYPGTVSAEEGGEERAYGVMYAAVIDVQTDEEGQRIYSLQDVNDPENAWTLSDRDIGDVVAEPEKGGMAALLFSGDIVQDAENVVFIAAVPDSTYRLGKAAGVTENNVMSTFTLHADDGQTMNFLKDNCQIEEGAMSQNAGDRVVVYYAYSDLEEIYYPLEIFSAE